MYAVNGTSIKLTRGDTFYTTVGIKNKMDGTEYTPDPNDALRFVLKRNLMSADKRSFRDIKPLIEKNIPIDTMRLKLEPEDTKPLAFGNYVYDIELTKANGDVDTIINQAPFSLLPEVD